MTYISNLLKSKIRYEIKYKNLENHLDEIKNVYSNVSDEDILYLKLNQKKGNLKKAINSVHREINYETIDNLINKMQENRNKKYIKNKKSLNYNYLESVIDGETNFYLKDRLNNIESFIEKKYQKIGSLEDIDSAKYVLSRIKKNKYLCNKKELKNLRKNVEEKLEEFISKNEKYYEKIKKKNKRSNVIKYFLTAGLILGSSLIPRNNKINRIDDHKIEIKKEVKTKIKKTIEYEDAIKEIKKNKPIIYNEYKAIIKKDIQKMEIFGKNDLGWDLIKDYSVSTGKNKGNKEKVGDKKTPEGEFEIISKELSKHWTFEGKYVYGPYFLRLKTPPWTGFGIHGTNEPYKIGERASSGCIRMKDEDLLEFIEDYYKLGMKIEIKK